MIAPALQSCLNAHAELSFGFGAWEKFAVPLEGGPGSFFAYGCDMLDLGFNRDRMGILFVFYRKPHENTWLQARKLKYDNS